MRCLWTNQRGQQCGQPAGHKARHGNGLLTSSRDEWQLIPEEKKREQTSQSQSQQQVQQIQQQIKGRKEVQRKETPPAS